MSTLIRRMVKILLIISLLSVSFGAIFTSLYGAIWPFLTVSLFLSLFAIVFSIPQINRSEFRICFSLVVLLAVSYRMLVFFQAGTLIGVDPHRFEVWISHLMANGQLDHIQSADFYSRAPLHMLLPTIFGLVLDISSTTSLSVYPVIVSLVAPTVTATLIRSWQPAKELMLLSAIFIAGSVTSIRFSFWPVAQTIASLYFLILLLGLQRYGFWNIKRSLSIISLSLVGLIYSHKISMVFAFFTLLFIILLLLLRSAIHDLELRPHISHFGIIFMLTSSLLYFQLQTTAYLSSVVFKLLPGLDERTVESLAVTSAVTPLPGWLLTFQFVFYFILISAFSGIGWIIVVYKFKEFKSVVILAAASATIVISVLGMVSGTEGYIRAFGYGEPVLILLIVLSLVHIKKTSTLGNTNTIVILALLIMSASLISPLITPDRPNFDRSYVTDTEVSSLEFTSTYVPEDKTIYTDSFYTIVANPISNEPEQNSYTNLDKELLQGSIDQNHVIYRNTVDVYSISVPSGGNYWTLTWSPETQLNHTHNRVQDTGESIYYSGENT